MARLSQNTLRTVRFYEESGLLKPVQRTEGGHRLFPTSELKKLKLVTDLRAGGFALDEIRGMLDAKRRNNCGADAAEDVIERLDDQIKAMADRIALLDRLVGELRSTRSLLGRCTSCTDDRRFPNACGECEVMTKAENLPNAVSVLWSLER